MFFTIWQPDEVKNFFYFTQTVHTHTTRAHTHIETDIINLFLDHIVQVPSANLVSMHFSFRDYEINMTCNLYTIITADNTIMKNNCPVISVSGCVCGCVCITKCLLWLGKPALLCHDMYAVLNLNRRDHLCHCSLSSLVTQISATLTWP